MTETPRTLQTKIWAELSAAVQQKNHAWRTPALATLTANGEPTLRTVVLRQVDVEQRQCFFYTDSRSAKCQQIQAFPRGELLFWCPVLQWQLRAAVDLKLLTFGPLVESVWQQIATTAAADDYLSVLPPGSKLTKTAGKADTPHLAVVIATVKQIDWLALSPTGHQHALLRDNQVQWLVP